MVGKNIEFVTRFYGERLLPLLVVSLESLVSHEPNVPVRVFISDVQQKNLDFLQLAFPDVAFSPVGSVGQKLPKSSFGRVSKKSTVYEHLLAADINSGHSSYVFDSDLLFRKGIVDELGSGWDLLFTVRPGRWPLNGGLVGIRHSARTHEFLSRVSQINSDVLSSSLASDFAAQEFGGPEQAAYTISLQHHGVWLDKLDPEKSNRLVTPGKLRVSAVPCSVYNAHYFEQISDHSRVIHLKSGWQPLVLGERGYTKSFPKKIAQPIVEEFRTYLTAVRQRVPQYRRSDVFRPLRRQGVLSFAPRELLKNSVSRSGRVQR